MKIIQASGKRKEAVARATVKPGKGRVIVNKHPVSEYGSPLTRTRIQEPIILAGKEAEKVDISVSSNGGGISGQADAIRLAIGRALAEYKPALKDVFLDYDRTLLVADIRRKETRKPNSQGQARSKRQKSYR